MAAIAPLLKSSAAAHVEGPAQPSAVHLMKLYRTLNGHTGFVNCLSTDGHLFVSGSNDTKVKIWDLSKEEGKECILTLSGDAGVVSAVAGVGNKKVVSGHAEGTDLGPVLLWNLESGEGKLLGKLPNHISALTPISKHHFFFSGGGGYIEKWDIHSGTGKRLTGSAPYVNDLKLHPDHETLISCCASQNVILLWDKEGNSSEFGKHEGVYTLAVSPDGQLLVSGGLGKHPKLNIWEIKSKKLLYVCSGHTDTITSIAFVDNNLLVSGALDKSLRFWNPHTGEWLDTIDNAHFDGIRCLAVLPDGLLASGSNDPAQNLKVWKKA